VVRQPQHAGADSATQVLVRPHERQHMALHRADHRPGRPGRRRPAGVCP
jgi:hypothetical protein